MRQEGGIQSRKDMIRGEENDAEKEEVRVRDKERNEGRAGT